MPYMEDIVQQRNHIMNEELQLINIDHEMERVAKKRNQTQKLDDFQKVLEIESECNELRSQLKTAESERLKLKYYISEENVARINEYIEVSEILINKNRRVLLERESQLRQTEEGLVIAWGQLRNLPHSDQEFSKHLHSLAEFMRDSDTRVPCRCELDRQRDTFKEALKIKDEEIAHLQHIFHGQKEEMEMKCTALGEKLLMHMKDRESNMRVLYEKDDSIRRKFSDIKIQFKKELLEKEHHLKKELSTIDEDFSGELSEKHEHFREELSQKEDGFKRKVLQTIKKEISERNKNIRKESQEALSQRLDMKEKEIFKSLQKELSESNDGFREMLFERKEHFSKELSDRNHSFMKELSERERTFKKEFSEKYNIVIELLSELEMKHQKLMKSIKARDRSSKVGNQQKISYLLDLDPDVTGPPAKPEDR
ncbi:hypothetical protein D4764_05G0009580 [Takifugu flavidus]|uniref:Uncharacterized protein n=1 Tax=Takifugu flavidus TaxID=433684 RepID=A0A5C6N287_9TELE|nr:hypothetical protein D4764_05G0009580 [Takifugu flavidus]